MRNGWARATGPRPVARASSAPAMPARFALSFPQVAAACFPLPGCSASGYAFAQRSRYNITIYTPAGAGCPSHYHATGRCCYEALAAAVQRSNA